VSNVLPVFALGRGTGALTLTPQTPNATTGVLTAGSSQSLLGSFKTFKVMQSNTLEDVSATSSRARNNMALDSGAKVEIGGIMLVTTNYAETLPQTNDYFAASCTRAGETITIFGIVESFTSEITGKGAISWTLSLAEIDIQTTNPIFT